MTVMRYRKKQFQIYFRFHFSFFTDCQLLWFQDFSAIYCLKERKKKRKKNKMEKIENYLLTLLKTGKIIFPTNECKVKQSFLFSFSKNKGKEKCDICCSGILVYKLKKLGILCPSQSCMTSQKKHKWPLRKQEKIYSLKLISK